MQGVGGIRSRARLGEAHRVRSRPSLVMGARKPCLSGDGSFDALFCECVPAPFVARKRRSRGICQGAEKRRAARDKRRLRAWRLGPGQPDGDGFIDKEWLTGLLTGLGFSVILWEEYERQLKEFAARMIFAGACLPGAWRCGQRLSYFLLAAVKGHGRTATP